MRLSSKHGNVFCEILDNSIDAVSYSEKSPSVTVHPNMQVFIQRCFLLDSMKAGYLNYGSESKLS